MSISKMNPALYENRQHTVPKLGLFQEIRLNFRKSVITIHYISVLEEQNNMVISIDD